MIIFLKKHLFVALLTILTFTQSIILVILLLSKNNQQTTDLKSPERPITFSDYVFDLYYDGKMNPEDMLKHKNFKILDIQDAEVFVRTNRHLPYIQSRNYWESFHEFPLNELISQQWVALEVLWLHVFELNHKYKKLQEQVIQLTTNHPATKYTKLTNYDLNSLPDPTLISNEDLQIIIKKYEDLQKADERLIPYKIEFEKRQLHNK